MNSGRVRPDLPAAGRATGCGSRRSAERRSRRQPARPRRALRVAGGPVRGRGATGHRQALRRSGARRQRGELRRDRVAARGAPEAKFLELAHRLDRETSGLLIAGQEARGAGRRCTPRCARAGWTSATWRWCKGAGTRGTGRVELPLRKYVTAYGRAARERGRRRAGRRGPSSGSSSAAASSAARSDALRPAARTRSASTSPHAGHPVVGDDKYGDFALNKALAKRGLKRMFLHARALGFDHPHRAAGARARIAVAGRDRSISAQAGAAPMPSGMT